MEHVKDDSIQIQGIKIKIKGQPFELTVEEAKKLCNDLNDLLGPQYFKNPIMYPPIIYPYYFWPEYKPYYYEVTSTSAGAPSATCGTDTGPEKATK
jgi:hypothetical protein